MTRRDRAVIAVLAVVLGALVVVVGIQSVPPPSGPAAPSPTPVAARPYVEGVVGRAATVSPLSARSEVERQLVALVFSGLLRNGPDGALVGDLADQWKAEADGSAVTFHLRDDALWHDGTPVTTEDVAFTIATLQDDAYTGPGAASWSEVTVRILDERTIRFALANPLGGFLQAATQPIVPAHVLAGIPIADLADGPFGQAPVGSGPFRLVSLDETQAVLEPAVTLPRAGPGVEPGTTADPTPGDILEPTPANGPVDRPVPYLAGMTFEFFESSSDLAAAYAAGDLDAASGLVAADASRLGVASDSRLLRYPTTTLSAVILNLRPGRPLFGDPVVRRALLAGLDRGAIVAGSLGGFGAVADAPIPPSSWAFDVASSTPVPFDPAALASGLTAAEWTLVDGTWRPPDSEGPFTIELIYPASASASTAAMAEAIASAWTAEGVATEAVPLPAAEFAAVRLREGDFDAALVSVSIGLDPDLYPLFASTQATQGGSNLSGIQDAALDELLEAARRPGRLEDRKAAYAALQVRLAERQYLLPIAFREQVVVVRDTVSGPQIRTLGDPGGRFWDVLTWRLANDR